MRSKKPNNKYNTRSNKETEAVADCVRAATGECTAVEKVPKKLNYSRERAPKLNFARPILAPKKHQNENSRHKNSNLKRESTVLVRNKRIGLTQLSRIHVENDE